MTGAPLPEGDHISRYGKGSQVHDDGRVDGAAFRLRVMNGVPETSLSVNWFEHLPAFVGSQGLAGWVTPFEQQGLEPWRRGGQPDCGLRSQSGLSAPAARRRTWRYR